MFLRSPDCYYTVGSLHLISQKPFIEINASLNKIYLSRDYIGCEKKWKSLSCVQIFATPWTTPSVNSVTQSCPTLCNPMDCRMPGFPVLHQILELAQTHVHRVSDTIQPSHPLLSPSPAFNLSQHQGLCKWVSSLHQVAKGLEFHFQHQSLQWTFRTDFL